MKRVTFGDGGGAASRFARASGGNVAVIFAIAMVPILTFVGAAIDYTRASTIRTAMQTAMDSAALMISKDNAAGTLTPAQLTAKAQTYFNALFTNTGAQGVSISAAYSSTTGQSITMTGSGSVATQFMRMAGVSSIGINTSATTTWGMTKLRVAMALDNTGSMSSNGKMSAMQTASKNLIDQLTKNVQTTGDVLISVVPFANVVNIGTGFKGSGYMDWSSWSLTSSIQEGYVCGSYNSAPSYWNGNVGTMRCGTAYNSTSNWNGCVMDRNQNYDVQVTPPTIPSAYYYADQSSYCPQQIQPLSSSWGQLKTTIDAMTPQGGTNQPIGLVWAWQTLKQTAPFNAPAEDPTYTYKKAIILLSDGLNTIDRWYGDGSTPSSQVDDRQRILCDNVKADGVTIYAIQVNTDSDPISSVLSYCASGAENFYMLTSANQILSTFDTIGTSLSKLRIAK
jgi:Flp pilus assembly protein TadG